MTKKNIEENEERKRIIKELEDKNKKRDIKKRQNSQIALAIFLMLFVIAIVFLVPYVMNNYVNKFSYINLDFKKEKYGEVMFYSTKIPLVIDNGNVVGSYGLDLRSDPRELEYIQANISKEDLVVLRNKKTYVSVASDIKPCEDNTIAIVNFGRFLNGFSQLDIKGATNDEKYSKEQNITYANCEVYPNNTVILIKNGNETKIERKSKNCYELTYKDCEIIQITEKFDLLILTYYMDNFERI
ncbi:hypothetical protein J4218_01415 [Candidatus Pacearchaeota archaeon]|nr:hypothetical protein [Candidatus Pacearchaeota archaeon]